MFSYIFISFENGCTVFVVGVSETHEGVLGGLDGKRVNSHQSQIKIHPLPIL